MISATHSKSSRVNPRMPRFFLAMAVFLIAASCEAADNAKSQGPIGVEAIDAFIATANIDKGSDKSWKTKLPTPPQVVFDSSKSYYWVLETNVGTISTL